MIDKSSKRTVIVILLNCAFLGALLPFLASRHDSSSSLRAEQNTVHYGSGRRLCSALDKRLKRNGCRPGGDTFKVPTETTTTETVIMAPQANDEVYAAPVQHHHHQQVKSQRTPTQLLRHRFRNSRRSAPEPRNVYYNNNNPNRNQKNIKYGQVGRTPDQQRAADLKRMKKEEKRKKLAQKRAEKLKNLNTKYNALDQEKDETNMNIENLKRQIKMKKLEYRAIDREPLTPQKVLPNGKVKPDAIRLKGNPVPLSIQRERLKRKGQKKMEVKVLKEKLAKEEEMLKTQEVATFILGKDIPGDIHKYRDQIQHVVKEELNSMLNTAITRKMNNGKDYKVSIASPLTKEQESLSNYFGPNQQIQSSSNEEADLDNYEVNPTFKFETIGGMGDKVIVPKTWEASNPGLTKSILGTDPDPDSEDKQ